MNSYSISAVLTAYAKDYHFLERSVPATPKDVSEIIVVGDGLSGNSDYQHFKDRIGLERSGLKFIETAFNVGLSSARNIGKRHVNIDTDFICFFDADDLLLFLPSLEHLCQNTGNRMPVFSQSCLQAESLSIHPFYDYSMHSWLCTAYGNGESATLDGKLRFLALLLEPQVGCKLYPMSLASLVDFPSGKLYEDTAFNLQFLLGSPGVILNSSIVHAYNTRTSFSRITQSPESKIDISSSAAFCSRILQYALRLGIIDIDVYAFATEALGLKFARQFEWAASTSSKHFSRALSESFMNYLKCLPSPNPTDFSIFNHVDRKLLDAECMFIQAALDRGNSSEFDSYHSY
jgi:glycosyltransferase involved in cell wall biosynthesis